MKILLIIFLGCSIAVAGASGEKYSYRLRIGSQETINTWTRGMIKPGRIELTATKTATGEFDKMICDEGYSTLEWFYTNKIKRTNFHAVRENSFIQISGEFEGKQLKKTIEIETAEWYQVPEFAISRMLAARKDFVIFSMFWIDKMSFYVMKAARIGEEKILIDGKEIDTIKVKMSLTGFKSVFWHADYWFRKSDFLIVKYIGVNGLPGTGSSVVELIAR